MRKLTDGLHGITRPTLSVPSLQNDTKSEKNKGSLCPQNECFPDIHRIFESTGFPIRGKVLSHLTEAEDPIIEIVKEVKLFL